MQSYSQALNSVKYLIHQFCTKRFCVYLAGGGQGPGSFLMTTVHFVWRGHGGPVLCAWAVWTLPRLAVNATLILQIEQSLLLFH